MSTLQFLVARRSNSFMSTMTQLNQMPRWPSQRTPSWLNGAEYELQICSVQNVGEVVCDS